VTDAITIDDLKNQLDELKKTMVQTEVAFHQVTGAVMVLEEIINTYEKKTPKKNDASTPEASA